eukprot:scaffold26140_cov147-Cylindrotheca_fusiformis.AAC.2
MRHIFGSKTAYQHVPFETDEGQYIYPPLNLKKTTFVGRSEAAGRNSRPIDHPIERRDDYDDDDDQSFCDLIQGRDFRIPALQEGGNQAKSRGGEKKEKRNSEICEWPAELEMDLMDDDSVWQNDSVTQPSPRNGNSSLLHPQPLLRDNIPKSFPDITFEPADAEMTWNSPMDPVVSEMRTDESASSTIPTDTERQSLNKEILERENSIDLSFEDPPLLSLETIESASTHATKCQQAQKLNWTGISKSQSEETIRKQKELSNKSRTGGHTIYLDRRSATSKSQSGDTVRRHNELFKNNSQPGAQTIRLERIDKNPKAGDTLKTGQGTKPSTTTQSTRSKAMADRATVDSKVTEPPPETNCKTTSILRGGNEGPPTLVERATGSDIDGAPADDENIHHPQPQHPMKQHPAVRFKEDSSQETKSTHESACSVSAQDEAEAAASSKSHMKSKKSQERPKQRFRQDNRQGGRGVTLEAVTLETFPAILLGCVGDEVNCGSGRILQLVLDTPN